MPPRFTQMVTASEKRERERAGVSRFLEIITKLNAFFSNGNASSIDCALHVDSAKRENTPVQ